MKPLEEYSSLEELYVLQEELAFKIAFTELEEEQNERDAARICEDEELLREAAGFFVGTERRTRSIIRAALSRERARSFARFLPRIAHIAVYVLFFAMIGMSTAVALVPSVRVQVTRFLINVQEEYTELYLEETSLEIDVPPEWNGEYYPAYIPEGYDEIEMHNLDDSAVLLLIKDENEYLAFRELSKSASANINTEDAHIYYEIIQGKEVFVAEREDYIVLTWAENDRYFIISQSGNTDKAIAFAKGIKKIK